MHIFTKARAIPVRGLELTCYGMLVTVCGKIPLDWISTSTGWAHAYLEGADSILQALPTAAQLKVTSAHDLGKVSASATELLLSCPFMESLCI